MARTNSDLFDRLLVGIDPQLIPSVSFGLNAALSNALTAVLTKALSLDEALEHVEWVARTLVDTARATTT